MRWLIVLPWQRPGHMGVDFAEELTALGHEVRTFAYRRDNVFYKNTGLKAVYQRFLAERLLRVGLAWRPALTLVIKGGPFGPEFIRRFRTRVGTPVVNVFPDNPLWMIPFPCVEAYDVFFTKERYALRALQAAGDPALVQGLAARVLVEHVVAPVGEGPHLVAEGGQLLREVHAHVPRPLPRQHDQPAHAQ